jgi:hypothetical protein
MTKQLELGANESVSIEDYHSDARFVSSTTLKKFAKSPALLNVKEEIARSSAFTVGSLVHFLALEQEEELERIHICEHDRRTKAYREWKADLPVNAIEVTTEEWRIAMDCVNALYGNDIANELLTYSGDTEVTFCWSERVDFSKPESQGSIACKFRPDRIMKDERIILDIKTCSKFSERDIVRAFTDYGYHIQVAHYLTGAAKWLDCSLVELEFAFIFVETEPPYRTAVIKLSPYSLERSLNYREKLLEDYLKALTANDFRDPLSKTFTQVTLPEWSFDNV